MATKTIAWQSGSGYITLSFSGRGDAPVTVTSDANNGFEDRQQYVSIVTTQGSPQRAVSLLVRQKGKTLPAGTAYDFGYTGGVQQVTLPKGRYKLQCWGAQGGNSSSYSGVGSKGGYSEGVLTLTQTTTLYIFVGGKGASSGNGGWNGGGGTSGSSSWNSGSEYGRSYPACGGGGTDIATVTSDMSYTSRRNNRSAASLLSRCIVAGGGAGASARYTEIETTTTSKVHLHTEAFTRVIFNQGTDSEVFAIESAYWLSGHSGDTIRVEASCSSDAKSLRILAVKQSDPSVIVVNTREYGVTSLSEEFVMPNYDVVIYITVSSLGNVYFPSSASGNTYYYKETTSTSTSSSKSTSSQQGGGTSGLGTSPGKQNSGGGEFGKGKNQDTTNYRYVSGAGGGGWYGGGTSHTDSSYDYINRSGGGSGFVNTAGNAGYRPAGYTALQLDSGTTTAGNSSFPSPSGGNETGHSGNGYARITVL